MNSQETRHYYQNNASARTIVLWVVCISAFLTPLSLSATLVAVPAIALDLNADAVYASWVPAAFLLSNMMMLLPGGRIADIYGRKRVFMLGNIIFIVGCILVAVAETIEMLLFFRVIQGLGAAMFFSTGMAILSSVFKGFGRGAALGWLVAAVYMGLTVGPLLGGWLTDQWGWQAVFFFQVPLALIGVLFGLWKMKGEWVADEPLKLDWMGTVLMAVWILLFFVGMSLLPSWESIVSVSLAAVFFYIFILHTDRAKSPLIKLKVVWENQIYSRSLIASMLMYAGSYGLVFLLGLYFQYNRGMTPTEAGQLLVLQAIVLAIFAPLSGRLSDRYPAQKLAIAGCLVFVASLVGFALIDDQSSIYLLAGYLVMVGLGFALFSTPNTNAALEVVDESKLGIASALLNLARLMGQMMGMTIVTLLMSLFIGNQAITPEHYDELLSVVHYTVILSLMFALLAAYNSMRFGRSPR